MRDAPDEREAIEVVEQALAEYHRLLRGAQAVEGVDRAWAAAQIATMREAES